VTINRFSGDKIVEDWYQGDDLGMMRQLGLIPSPE
jgi:predicted ester cyclase